jgi:type IV secretion system protein VirB4
MFDGSRKKAGPASHALARFKARIAGFEDVFESLFPAQRLKRLSAANCSWPPASYDALLRYVRRCICIDDFPFACPDFPIGLCDLLATDDFCGGIEPRIGHRHLRVVAIDGFPKASVPGILGALDSLAIEYRWNSRAILLDTEEARAFLDKTRKKWRSQIRGWKDQIFRTLNGPVNLHAQEMATDAEEAMGVASAGDVQFAFYTSVIICADEDPDHADEAAALAAKTLQNLGFNARLETVKCNRSLARKPAW